MASEYELSKVKAEAPELDDGWWASVLADEDAYLAMDEEVFPVEETAGVLPKQRKKRAATKTGKLFRPFSSAMKSSP